VWLAYDTKRGSTVSRDDEPAAPRVAPHKLATPLTMHLCIHLCTSDLWRDVSRLRRLSREVDVLHVHTSHDHALVALSGAAARAVTVRTFHAKRWLEPRFGQRWLSGRADGWVVRSDAHRACLAQLIGASLQRVVVAPGGIDADEFTPASLDRRAEARRLFGIPSEARVLLHVALINGRGQEELARALVHVNSKKLRVLYVGEGEQRAALELLAKSVGLKAHFAGYLRGDDLKHAYAAADAAFLAQPGNDASARAGLEAMASELPLIAVTEDPALRELVTERVGYPVPERAPAAISTAIARWLNDPLAFERGRRGRQFVQTQRSFAHEAERTLELYGRIPARR